MHVSIPINFEPEDLFKLITNRNFGGVTKYRGEWFYTAGYCSMKGLVYTWAFRDDWFESCMKDKSRNYLELEQTWYDS